MSRHDPSRRTALRLGTGLLLAALPLTARAAPRERTLVIGKVSDNPKGHYRMLKGLADYAAARMGDLGIEATEVSMAADEREMSARLARGEVDWVGETLYSALRFERAAGAEMMLRTWKKGVPEYRTLFFTRQESPIRQLADLRGRRLALQDPGSTTAFFLPLSELAEQGIAAQALTGPGESPPPERVGYLLAGAELNITAWVHRGQADAGAFSDLDWATKEHAPARMREELRVFHETAAVPRAVELLRRGFDPARRERLISILQQADQDPEGRRVLFEYQKTRCFDRIDTGMRRQIDHLAASLRALPAGTAAP